MLQIVAANVNPEWFMTALLESFYLVEAFELRPKTNISVELNDNWRDYLLQAALRYYEKLRVETGCPVLQRCDI